VSGALIAEVEDAHYLTINDLAVSDDLCATGGKDTKVRVWIMAELFAHNTTQCRAFHEFGDA